MVLRSKLNAVYVGCIIFSIVILRTLYENHNVTNSRLSTPDNYDIYHQISVSEDSTYTEIPINETSISSTLNMSEMIYILNGSQICDKSTTLFLTTVIISKPEDSDRRSVIRNSWAKPLLTSNLTSVAFFVGNSKNKSIREKIIFENENHKDLIVVDFDESYRNLSLKTILMYRWIRDFCPNTRFILKTDDDMFVNVYNLMNFLREDEPKPRTIYGRLGHKWPPIRNNDSKWMVTEKEFNETFYPDFVTGGCYVVEIEAVSDILEVCVRLPYLFLEDVFVTGICAQRVNVTRLKHEEFVNESMPGGNCRFYTVISTHGGWITSLHQRASDFSAYEKCSKRVPKIF